METGEALDRVDAWLSSPAATVVEPGGRHPTILRDLLRGLGAGGNVTSDAQLAALAIEHLGSVVSFDSDFARFDGHRWEQPS